MVLKSLTVGAMLLALGQTAAAGEKPTIIHRVSCSVVRFYVAKYSASAAETWARGRGATDAEIETARRCLSSASVQTGSSVAR